MTVFAAGALAQGMTPSWPNEAALWKAYRENPDAHPNIPNCSFAGYAYGEKPLPDVKVVVNAKDFGAVGDGKTDATEAINKAIKAAAEKGGGAVLLPAGTYVISGVLWMHHDGVVLRGEGQEKTRIHCTRPLDTAYGKNNWGGKSAWSWSGGMIWFAPAEHRGPGREVMSRGKEGWLDAGKITGVSGEAKRGDWELTVADASGLKAGQKVILSLTDAGDGALFANASGDVPGTKEYNWKTDGAGLMAEPEWRWPVEIAAVEGNKVKLKQPLRLDVRAAWKPALLKMGPLVQESGVEELTISMAPARLSPHLENPGWNGICFENAWNCWAKNVTVRDVDNGLGTIASKCITLDGFTVTGRNCHHATYTRMASHDNLFTRFVIQAPVHHGINVEQMSTGNVWSAGDMAHGTFDSHRALPFENIRTDITIHNDGGHGGSGGAGPLFGARFAHWNIRVTNGRAAMVHTENMMPRGAVVGVTGTTTYAKPYPDFKGDQQSVVESSGKAVAPRDLHVAQVALRTGTLPLHLGRPIDLAVNRSDGTKLELTWDETFMAGREYIIARQEGKGEWNNTYARVNGPAGRFEDTAVKPGETYYYKVHAVVDGKQTPASPAITMVNRPPMVTGLAALEVNAEGKDATPAHGTVWEPGGVRIAWSRTPEKGGKIVIDRREGDEKAPWKEGIATLDVDAVSYLDKAVEPGKGYTYRVRVSNVSGSSVPAETETLTRSAGTMVLRESFDATRSTGLPAASEGKTSWGQWKWVGVNGDREPELRSATSDPREQGGPGELAWPITRQGAKSFVYTENIRGDLSGKGAKLLFDYSIGGSGGPSTHMAYVVVKLADGTWAVGPQGYTEALRGWYTREFTIAGDEWRKLDVKTLEHGERIASPDMSKITGIGLRIDRPINNRFVIFDDLQLWGRDLKIERN